MPELLGKFGWEIPQIREIWGTLKFSGDFRKASTFVCIVLIFRHKFRYWLPGYDPRPVSGETRGMGIHPEYHVIKLV